MTTLGFRRCCGLDSKPSPRIAGNRGGETTSVRSRYGDRTDPGDRRDGRPSVLRGGSDRARKRERNGERIRVQGHRPLTFHSPVAEPLPAAPRPSTKLNSLSPSVILTDGGFSANFPRL